MTLKIKKKLKEQLSLIRNENARVNIGKNGLTEEIYLEIKKQLEKNELLKIKFLQNYITENLDTDIEKITKNTQSILLEKRGKTIILYKSIKKS